MNNLPAPFDKECVLSPEGVLALFFARPLVLDLCAMYILREIISNANAISLFARYRVLWTHRFYGGYNGYAKKIVAVGHFC